MSLARPTALALGLALAAGSLAMGAKLMLVHAYGSDVPYFDEWDAVGTNLLVPAAAGELHASAFFRPQNEHRIVLSRLISYALVRANGQWDALLEMTASAVLHAALCAALVLFSSRLVAGLRLAGVAAVTVLLFVVPFAWENTLQGLQSQHYLLLWTAFGSFLLCLRAAPLSGRWWAGLGVAALGLGSMASGFVAAAVLVAAGAARCAAARRVGALDAAAAALLATLCAVGILSLPATQGGEALRAHSAGAWFAAAAAALAWPDMGRPVALAVLQLPVALLALARLRARRLSPDERVLASLALWTWAQIAALAYARSSFGLIGSSRYMDLYAIGSYCNAVALALLWRPRGALRTAAVAAWAAAFGLGLWGVGRGAFAPYLERFPELKAAERRHIGAFLATGDPAVLKAAPRDELPYPDAGTLAQVLSAPALRALLPASVRTPLALSPGPGTYGFEPAGPEELVGAPPGQVWIARHGPARFVSKPIPPGLLAFLHISISGSRDLGVSAVRLDGADGSTSPSGGLLSGRGWAAVDLAVAPESTAHLVADVPPGEHWLAFSAPVELGYLSWLNRWLLRRTGILTAAAAAAFAAAALAVAAGDLRRAGGTQAPGP